MSGATIGGVIGGAVGYAFGGPLGGQIGYAAGSIIGGAIDPEHIQGTRLGEIAAQTSAEGVPRPIPYGSPEPFAGNLIQAGPHIRSIKETREDGKGGGPVVENEVVQQTYAIRICEGRRTGVQVIQVWRDAKMVLDRTGRNLLDAEGIQFQTKAFFYPGDESQLPDPTLEGLPIENGGGVGNVPAYRGSCYMVVAMDDLTGTGGRIPTHHFRVSSNATVTETCTEEGLIFWWPLDDADAGGTAREVIQGANGAYGPSGIGTAAPLTPTAASSFRVASGGYMWTPDTTYAPGFFSVQNLDQWSTSIVAQPTEEIGGSVAKNMFSYYQNVAAGFAEFTMALDDLSSNMTPAGAVGQGSGDSIPIGGSGSASIHFPDLYTMTWQSNTPGDPDDVGTLSFYVGANLAQRKFNTPNASRTGSFIAIGGIEFPTSLDFIGYLQDAKIYNYARSQDEIAITLIGIGPSDDFWPIPDSPGSFVDKNGNKFTPCTSTATIQAETLASIKLDIALRCGIDASEMDVEADEDILVDGYLIGKQMSGQAAIRPLDEAYFRDSVEYDTQIHSIPRGGAVVRDLPLSAFINEPKKDRTSRRQMIELPKGVNLGYSDPEQNYARGVAPYRRQSRDVPAESVVSIEFPLVFARSVAMQKAEIWMKSRWEEAEGEFEGTLPFYANADLVPSDPVTIEGRRYRITKTKNTDNRLEIVAVRDRVRNYESAAVGSVPLDPTAPVSSIRGPTVFTALNLPRLNSAWNSPGMVVAGTGLLEGWPGALLYMSVDGGLTWVQPATIDRRATMGRLVNDIGASGEPIVLELFDGRYLSSITAEQAALRLNGFSMTTNEISEVAQFLTAIESSSGDQSIYDISRGQLETDAAQHYRGDDFLLLDDAIVFVRIDAAYAGREIMFRPVTRGTPIENNPTYTVTFLPQFTGPEAAEFYEDETDDEYVDDFGNRYQVT